MHARAALLVVLALGAAAPAWAEPPLATPPNGAPTADGPLGSADDTDGTAVATPPSDDGAAVETVGPGPRSTHRRPVDDEEFPLHRAPDAGMSDLISAFLKTMLMLALVVGLAYLTLQKGLGKLVAKAQQGQRVWVVERVSLGDRRSVVLVTVDGRELLLGVSEGGVRVLDEPAPKDRFAAVLDERCAAKEIPAPGTDADPSPRREDV